jgi:pyruvate dehydrogenase (quinone)
MQSCDTVLILGSTMPWEEYYPKPGQARGVQVDLKPDRLGLRYPVEIGLTGDVKATLQGLLPLLTRKTDRSFLQEAQRRMTDWNQLLENVVTTARSPLRPQMVVRTLSGGGFPGIVLIELKASRATYWKGRERARSGSERDVAASPLAFQVPPVTRRSRPARYQRSDRLDVRCRSTTGS